MKSLALVFNPVDDLLHETRVSDSIKELCAYWILFSVDDNCALSDDIRHAMEGINGELINLTTTPKDILAGRINQLLLGKASHLMLLQPGSVIECERNFLPVRKSVAEQVLHISPSREVGVWLTTIVPNTIEDWQLDNSKCVVGNPHSETYRNSTLRILDHNRFPRRRSPTRNDIKELLHTYQALPNALSSMPIAQAFYKSQDYQQAVDWFRLVLEEEAGVDVRWQVIYRTAQCLMKLEVEWEAIQAQLAMAFDIDPDRMEPLYYLVKHYRETGEFRQACDLAAIAMQIDEPPAGSEFEMAIYRYLLAREYAECCWQLEDDSMCIELVNNTLRKTFIPEADRRELASLRARAYERICPVYPVNIHRKNRLLLIIAFRNAGEFLNQCIKSIQQQDFPYYRVILVDDASTDSALSAVGDLDERFTILVNEQRRGALHNQLHAIRKYARDDEIVIHLDGDDWLAHDGALARINDFFNRTCCWLMYGQFENSLGNYGSCEPLVPNGEPLFDQLNRMHFPMHIRAYRAGILSDLLRQDPDLEVLRDEHGNFLDAVSDLALMRALIQVAGIENTRYNEEILYIYNRSNPESHYMESDSMTLQREQCAFAADKPVLHQAESYHQLKASRLPAAKTSTMLLALDGTTPSLITKWVEEGYLPNIAKFFETCKVAQINGQDGLGNDVFWNTLCTGCLPDETGYFFRLKWNPDSYQIDFRSPQHQVKQDLFWTRLASTDAEIAVIDMPEVKFGGKVNGLEISSWLPHARHSDFQACPSELQEDVISRFGSDPFDGYTERTIPRSDEETERDLGLLHQSIRQQTQAAKHYLRRGGWDFFAVGFQQPHSAGHQFWHLHDDSHSRFSTRWFNIHGDPLLEIYRQIDSCVGELIDTAGEGADVVMISGLAMQSKISCNSILDLILWEIDVYDRRLAGQDYPDQTQLERRRFIAVPHNHLSGAIRINLAGRESRGIVAEGSEYDQIIDMLQKRLSKVINPDTRETVVSRYIPTREVYTGNRLGELADLFVVWNRDAPIYRVSSPYFEPIKIRVRGMLDTRSGDHTGEATLYSNVDSMIGEKGEINVEDISAQLVNLINTGQKI